MIKKTVYLFLLALVLLFSCNNEHSKRNLQERLTGIRWENSDLNFIVFDSALIYIPLMEIFPTECAYEYSIRSDTLIIINKTVNAYNLTDFKDTVSYLAITSVKKDSIRLNLLNSGAKELFNGFNSLVFYNSNKLDRFTYYKERDTSCLREINTALKEIKNGNLVLCFYTPWPFRQKDEFIELLGNHGIEFYDMGAYPDILPLDRNCFSETMNYYIQKKYGLQFTDNLLREADTLMVKNNRSKFFKYYECDERPPIENLYVNVDLPVRKKRCVWKNSLGVRTFAVYEPFMDIQFHIDTTGEIFNFYLNSYYSVLEWNSQFKDELFGIGVENIEKIKSWPPGKIAGFKVRTEHIVRVHFENDNE